MTVYDNSIYVGTTTGGLRAFDARHLKYQIHTYKGFTGSVTDIEVDENGKFICSSSLDRYIRVHNANSTALMYQNYIKSKGTAVLVKAAFDSKSNQSSQSDASVIFVENESEGENGNDNSDMDDLFDNMETIEHERNDVPEEPPAKKKRKSFKK